jgi:hypothetical protein
MLEKNSHTDLAERSSLPRSIPAEFAAMGKKRIEELAEMQADLFKKFEEANRHWLDRMQVEAGLAFEFGAKVIAARSIPDMATACQKWASRRMEIVVEDAKRLTGETQKFIETGFRLLSGRRDGGA